MKNKTNHEIKDSNSSSIGPKPGPEDTVKALFEAARHLDDQVMADLILPANAINKKAINQRIEELRKNHNLEGFKKGAKHLRIDITRVNRTGNKATVIGTCYYMDIMDAMPPGLTEKIEYLLNQRMAGVKLSEEELKDLDSKTAAQASLEDKEILKNSSITLKLIYDNHSWYIKEIDEELLDILSLGFRRVRDHWEKLINHYVVRYALVKIQAEEEKKQDDRND